MEFVLYGGKPFESLTELTASITADASDAGRRGSDLARLIRCGPEVAAKSAAAPTQAYTSLRDIT
jgi:hypothetical protein